MSDELDHLREPEAAVRLFPLPNLVLYPHVMQPLHIFEPRYRQMTRDALASDRLIAMALLRPGWESDYEGNPELYPVVCVGKIVAEQELDDGRFNLLVRGMSRARLVEEVNRGKLYRCARVALLEDVPPTSPKKEAELRRRLVELAPSWFPAQGAVMQQFHKLLKSDLSLGVLCDVLLFAVPLNVEVKQQLLEELHVERRARRLLEQLKKASPPQTPAPVDRRFPPEFSAN
jgi:Lon protease-like protein